MRHKTEDHTNNSLVYDRCEKGGVEVAVWAQSKGV